MGVSTAVAPANLPFSNEDLDCAKALMTMHRWVVRRVETVEFRDEYQVTRRMEADFYVPPGAGDEASREHLHLPLTVLDKRPPAASVDVLDERAQAVPLLSKAENAALSAAALGAALMYILPSAPAETVRATCSNLAGDPPEQAKSALTTLTGIVRQHRSPTGTPEGYRNALRLQRWLFMARQMIGNSIIWIINVDTIGTRRIITLSYGDQLEVLTGATLRIATFFALRSFRLGLHGPQLHSCRTYHFQMTSPSALQLRDPKLGADIREATDLTRSRPYFLKAEQRDLHLYVNLIGAYTLRPGSIAVKCRIRRQGFLSLALASALLIAALLWSAWALRGQLDLTAASHVMPPVLLLIPAMLVALMNRPGEHSFSTMLLTGLRSLIALSGVLASIAAAVIAFVRVPSHSDALERAWLACAIGSSAIAGLVLWSWVASLPPAGRWRTGATITGLAAIGLTASVVSGTSDSVPMIAAPHAAALACGLCIWRERRVRAA